VLDAGLQPSLVGVPARCHQELLPPLLHKPLLLGPAPLQVLVLEINGSHGKMVWEFESCGMSRARTQAVRP
jgi:hypothetical protein